MSSKTARYCYVPYVRRVLEFPLDWDLHMIDESIFFYLGLPGGGQGGGPAQGRLRGVWHGLVWPDLFAAA